MGIIYEKATCICSATGFRVFDNRLLTQSFRRKDRFCAKAAFSTQNMRLFAASRPNSPAAQTVGLMAAAGMFFATKASLTA